MAAHSKFPKDLPTFNPDKDDITASMFLERLVCALEIEEVPRGHWTRALVKSLRGPSQLWAKRNILDIESSWIEAQELFLHQYSNIDETLEQRAKLVNMAQSSTETARQYSERFMDVLHYLREDATSPSNLYLFQRGLRDDIQGMFAAVAIHEKPKSIAEATKIAITLEVSLSGRKRPTPSSESSDNRNKRRPIGKPTSSESKQCRFHPESHSHWTHECRNLDKLLKEKTASTLRKNDTEQPKPPAKRCDNCPHLNNHTTAECRRQKTTTGGAQPVTCFKCRQEGHKADACPNKKVFSIEHSTSGTPVNDEFLVPISVDSFDTPALLDTGAELSVISKRLADTLGVPILERPGCILYVGAEHAIQRLGSAGQPLTVRAGERSVKHVFEVMDLREGLDCILGRDLFHALGFVLSKIPHTKPEFAHEYDEEESDQIPEGTIPGLDPHPQRDQILSSVAPCIARNQEGMTNQFCQLPEARVRLETKDEEPVFLRQYKIPQAHEEAVTNQVKKWLEAGVVEKISFSPYNNPLTTAVKKNFKTGQRDSTKVRVCIDTRMLNKKLKPVNFHLPLIADIFEALNGSCIFSGLDLEGAFHRLPIDPEHRHKLAFRWLNQSYQFVGAPFGVTFLSQQFQYVMSTILADFSAFALVFIDDIIIFSKTPEEHTQHLQTVIDALTKHNFRLSMEKCQFAYQSVYLLGHHINQHGITIDRRKLTGLRDWPLPTAATIESYLGLFNYFRCFLPSYASLTAPLESVRKTFGWGDDQQRAWEATLDQLEQAPFLHFPDFSQPFYLATDGSKQGIAATLFQIEEGHVLTPPGPDQTKPKKYRYLSFQSRALTPTERRYPPTKLEMLAGVFGLSKFRQYLLGRHFTWLTDHRSLVWLHNDKELSRVTNTWIEIVLEYDFEVVHLPGITNILPDRLSRIYPPSINHRGSETDNLPVFALTTSASSTEPTRSIDATAQQQPTPTMHDRDGQSDEQQDREATLIRFHEFGHFGAKPLMKTLKENGIRWPNIFEDCKRVTSQCTQCQRHQVQKKGFHPQVPITASLPFDHIQIDTVGPLPRTADGFNYVITCIDIATKFVLLRPSRTKMAEEIADILYKIMADFGNFRILQSDNGSEYSNSILRALKGTAGFQHRFSAPYNPRCNGAVEKANHIAISTLKKMLHDAARGWKEMLPMVQLAINNKIGESTASTPFALMFNRPLNSFGDHSNTHPGSMSEQELQERLHMLHDVVYPGVAERISARKARAKSAHDRTHNVVAPLTVGTFVMTIDKTRSSKLDPIYEGPYQVVQRTNGGTYRLLDTDGTLLTRAFPIDQLKVVSVPDPKTKDDVYQVERIIAHRGTAPRYEYLVRWKGWSEEDDTWEPEANLIDRQCLQKYWKDQEQQRD